MFYGFRLLEELHMSLVWLVGIAGVLLLEGIVLGLLSRRHSASRSLRILLLVTLLLAISAGLFAGYTAWQIRTLDPRLPFTRLPDGNIQFIRRVGASVVLHGLPVIMGGAALVLLRAGAMLAGSLANRLLTLRQHQPPPSALGSS